ncbi:MAG: hypothetical protein K0S76_1967 [Herbinix sp.]|jgi:hypothetical protein|nr:hypothetical protein [Herbinix sp.]
MNTEFYLKNGKNKPVYEASINFTDRFHHYVMRTLVLLYEIINFCYIISPAT